MRVLAPITCPKCGAPLPPESFNTGYFVSCRSCGGPVRAEVFPALYRPPETVPAENASAPGDATCFYHAHKTAKSVCAGCGRFVCALCEVDLGEGPFCPSCLSAGRKKGKIAKIERGRMRYDKIALTLAIVPSITIIFTILSAPAVLFMVVKYWNAPRSLVSPSGWRFVVAGIIAMIQVGLWVTFFVRTFI